MHESDRLYNSFRIAFHTHYQPLCQYAFSIVKEMHGCEDIVQETFLRVWEKKQNLVGTKELTWYLYTAVRNNCFTYLQKQHKTILGEIEAAGLNEVPYDKPAAPAKETDYNTLLETALANLPPKCREVFVLSRVSNLTYQQIGDSMGISIKTVENQMSKALKILRAYIKSQLFNQIIIGVFQLSAFYTYLT